MNATEVHIFGSFLIIFLQQEGWACASVAAASTAFIHGEIWQQALGRQSDHVHPRNAEFEIEQNAASSPLPVGYHRLRRTTALSQHPSLAAALASHALRNIIEVYFMFNFK